MTHVLVVVDVQNDFCEGGSLPVRGGSEVARAITTHLSASAAGGSAVDPAYDHVVATRDYHIDPGGHFSAEPDYIDSWPPHCVVGTPGVALHPDLATTAFEAVFDKGEYSAAYSGFEGTFEGVDIGGWLRARGADTITVVGLATDHCVRATAMDAVRLGLRTRVLLGLTAGVAHRSTDQALEQLRRAGVLLVEGD